MSAEVSLILLALSGLFRINQGFFTLNSMQAITVNVYTATVLHLEVDSQCRPIGTNNETAFTAARDRRFYLNIDCPAPCNGTITSWRYCYYRPNTNDSNRYHVTWAVYRRMGSGNDTHYVAVPSSVRTAVRSGDQITSNNDSFSCLNQSVWPNVTVAIEAGDVVGACIYEPGDNADENIFRRQLDIVGQMNGYSLMQMKDIGECGFNSTPSNISSSLLSAIDSSVLHLYANIESRSIHNTMFQVDISK